MKINHSPKEKERERETNYILFNWVEINSLERATTFLDWLHHISIAKKTTKISTTTRKLVSFKFVKN